MVHYPVYEVHELCFSAEVAVTHFDVIVMYKYDFIFYKILPVSSLN